MAIIKQDYGQLWGGKLAVESLIAPVQKTLIADKTYNVGDQFIYDDRLYKVTVQINTTDNIVIGTNAELADDVTTQIKAVDISVSDFDSSNVSTIYYAFKQGNFVLFSLRVDGITFNSSDSKFISVMKSSSLNKPFAFSTCVAFTGAGNPLVNCIINTSGEIIIRSDTNIANQTFFVNGMFYTAN